MGQRAAPGWDSWAPWPQAPHGLDPATGEDRWRFDGGGSYGNALSTSAAILPDGTVVIGTTDGRLLCLE